MPNLNECLLPQRSPLNDRICPKLLTDFVSGAFRLCTLLGTWIKQITFAVCIPVCPDL
jgi:hypothetical protein